MTKQLGGSCQGPPQHPGGWHRFGPVWKGLGLGVSWLGCRKSMGESRQRMGPCLVSVPGEAPGCLVIQQVAAFQL